MVSEVEEVQDEVELEAAMETLIPKLFIYTCISLSISVLTN